LYLAVNRFAVSPGEDISCAYTVSTKGRVSHLAYILFTCRLISCSL